MKITDEILTAAQDAYHQNTHCYGDNKFHGQPLQAAIEAVIPMIRDEVLEDCRDEIYAEGYDEGQREARGAHADLWSMLIAHLQKKRY